MLSRDQILNANDRAQKVVPVKEWGGDVMLTALSVKDRAAILGDWSRLAAIQKEGGDIIAAMLETKLRLVALSITDEAGAQLFTEQDVEALAQKCDAAIGVISDAAIELNRFAVGATEDAAKN